MNEYSQASRHQQLAERLECKKGVDVITTLQQPDQNISPPTQKNRTLH
jgi:hypothetical protein